ncbi:MAG: ROK family transcriptional regulator [Clostridiales Family XIII bacterium]|jgi:predicted NBD/HSP70 family sugar kinase|nr:ROK family transcriptional regulator [Clostridiales Family XIII bacterium]
MDSRDIKIDNRQRIYRYIRKKKVATKKDIATGLGLSLPTVTQNLKRFLENGLISGEEKLEIKSDGRNPVAYRYLNEAKVAVGVSSTRNHIRLALVDIDGNIMASVEKKHVFERSGKYMKLLGRLVQDMVDAAGVDESKLLGVGIAVTGLVDEEAGKVIYGKIVDNEGLTREDYSKYIPYPTKLIHDTNAYGFCEVWLSSDMGSITGLPDAFYVNISNSVGGAMLRGEGVFLGDGLYSGEIGHTTLVPGGLVCYCGHKGCADPYCSVERLSSHTGGELDAFFERLAKGDKKMRKVWDEYLDYVAMLLCNVRMIWGGSVILGGYLRDYIDDYAEDLMDRIDRRNPFGEKASGYLYLSNNRKPVETGAALYYIKEFLDKI